jgi:glycosyltransferase involved in cell wall biosynthesis
LKILVIHSEYVLKGGEDTVVEQEILLLKERYDVDILYFQNKAGFKGVLQFISSIGNRKASKLVRNKIKQFNPDVVHVHNWHFATGPIIFRTINKLCVPVVHTIHNYRLLCPSAILLNKEKLFIKSLEENFPWSSVFKKVYRNSIMLTFWLAFVIWFHKKRGTFKLINVYLCLTSFAQELFLESRFGIEKDKFVIKPNFTLENISMPSEDKSNYLFIGRLSEEKGIFVLLEAFKERKDVLRIGGDGPLKELVLNYARQFPNIKYLGVLTKQEVTFELESAKALIFPSIWYEGMPMTILEAFAAKTLVIASNLGAMKSLIVDGENGYFFEAGSSTDLYQTVMKFESISDFKKQQMSENSFETYQKLYSKEKQYDYFDFIYNKALHKPF